MFVFTPEDKMNIKLLTVNYYKPIRISYETCKILKYFQGKNINQHAFKVCYIPMDNVRSHCSTQYYTAIHSDMIYLTCCTLTAIYQSHPSVFVWVNHIQKNSMFKRQVQFKFTINTICLASGLFVYYIYCNYVRVIKHIQ